jgi:photosystem II stability/assembly factor-like uncharacterized protein
MKIFLIFFIVFILSNSPSYTQWIQQNTGTTKNLYGITSSHSTFNFTWACGEDGIIIYTSNGGQTWVQQNSGTTVVLYSIAFQEIVTGPVIAVGQYGTILKTVDNGNTWVQVPSGTNQHLRHISDFGTMACGDSGVIIKSTNAGVSWFRMTNTNTNDLYAVSGGFGNVSVGKNGTVLKYNSSQSRWETLNSGTITDLLSQPMFTGDRIFSGKNGLIMKYNLSTFSWEQMNTGVTVNINYIEESNLSVLYGACDSGIILKSTDVGFNWGRQISNVTKNLNSTFCYLSELTGFICGNNGVVLKTTNGGGPVTSLNIASSEIPESFQLHQNFPNPFNMETKIGFQIPESGSVSLKIYDVTGREITKIVNEKLQAGEYEFLFNADKLAGGVYFYRLELLEHSSTKKFVLLK